MRELKQHKCKKCNLKIVLVEMEFPQKDKTVKKSLSWCLMRMYLSEFLPHVEYSSIQYCPFCGKELKKK